MFAKSIQKTMRITLFLVFILLIQNVVRAQSHINSYVENYHDKNYGLFLRVSPLLLLGAQLQVESEYFIAPKHSVAIKYTHIRFDPQTESDITLFTLAMKRQNIDLHYKFYPKATSPLFISPFIRFREWTGRKDHFFHNYPYSEEIITSHGVAIGGLIGARLPIIHWLDITFYTGLNAFVYDTVGREYSPEFRSRKLADFRLGINLGFRIFK
jgi:hypothetical protein